MISQGYPLWAVESDGTPHIVVGWDRNGYPHTIPARAPGLGLADFPDGTWFTFTTTDPTKRPDINAISYKYADLEQRLAALAQQWERNGWESFADAIRAELAK